MSVFNAGLPNSGVSAFPSTRQIINTFSSGGAISAAALSLLGKSLVSGALTANVLQNMLTITGKAEISALGITTLNTTSKTLRLQVVVDGVVVFDATSATVANTGFGMVAAGSSAGTPAVYSNLIRCNSSLVVNVASSVTETGGVGITYAGQTF